MRWVLARGTSGLPQLTAWQPRQLVVQLRLLELLGRVAPGIAGLQCGPGWLPRPLATLGRGHSQDGTHSGHRDAGTPGTHPAQLRRCPCGKLRNPCSPDTCACPTARPSAPTGACAVCLVPTHRICSLPASTVYWHHTQGRYTSADNSICKTATVGLAEQPAQMVCMCETEIAWVGACIL